MLPSIPVVDVQNPDAWPRMTAEDYSRGYRILQSDRNEPLTRGVGEISIAEKYRMRLSHSSASVEVVYDARDPPSTFPLPFELLASVRDIPSGNPELALERAVQQGSEEDMFYYICDAETPDERRALGLPAHRLRTTARLLTTRSRHQGVHFLYGYFSPGPSFTVFHKEDAGVGSSNFLRWGARKLWLLVPSYHSAKLEALLQRELGCDSFCDQFVREQRRIFAPSFLRQNGIHFGIVEQLPGQVVETACGSVYHYVWNSEANFAEAINCCEPDWMPPPLYRYCGKSTCGTAKEQITAETMEPGIDGDNDSPLTLTTPTNSTQVFPEANEKWGETSVSSARPGQKRSTRQSGKKHTSVRQALSEEQPEQGPNAIVSVNPGEQEGPGGDGTSQSAAGGRHKDPGDVSKAYVTDVGPSENDSRSGNRDEVVLDPSSRPIRKVRNANQVTSANAGLQRKSPRQALVTLGRNKTLPATDAPSKRPKTGPKAPLGELEQIVEQVKAVDRRCKIPAYRPQDSPEVVKLVAAIWSRPTIEQFCSLVRSRRQLDNGRGSSPRGASHTIDLALSIQKSDDQSTLGAICVRLNQWRLTEELEHTKRGRKRNKPSVLNAICRACGWTRDQLKYHRLRGQKWRRLCGPYPGLISFILAGPNRLGLSSEAYLGLDESEIPSFHALLKDDYTSALCSAGMAFEQSLDEHKEDIEFRWESTDIALGEMSENDMLNYILPFPTGRINCCDDIKDWPRPDYWLSDWSWPTNPLQGQDGQNCDLCPMTTCECALTKFADGSRPQPRIRDYGQKGRGLQAIAKEPGQVAYKDGDRIGRLVGDVVLVKPEDRYTVEIVRPDLSQAGPVCYITCQRYGSVYRLANHGCDPPAVLRPMMISGYYALVLAATRDIHDGEEIEFNYGRGYFKGQRCLCRVCADK